MASAKQIAWRKKFARMSKAGKFKKSSKTFLGIQSPISSGFKPIPSSKLRKGTVSNTMAIRAEAKKKGVRDSAGNLLKGTTGYIVDPNRHGLDARIFVNRDDALKWMKKLQARGGSGLSDKTTLYSRNPKFHKVGNYWTP